MKSKNKEIRTNTFYLSTYCTKDFVQDVLNRKIEQIKSYAYIVHDKDVYLDNVIRDKELIHSKGDAEIVHIHIFLELYYSRYSNEIISWFKCFDENNQLINTFKEYPYCCQSCLDYLIHKWNPEKYQYSPDEVISYGLTKLDNGELKANDYDLTFDIIQSLMNGESLQTIIKRYGKDFVYHYRQYKDIVSDLLDLKRYGHDFRGNISRTDNDEYEYSEDNLPF